MPASASSSGVRGAAVTASVAAGASAAGRARRSTLPLGVSGSASTKYEGRRHHVLGQALAHAALRSSAAPTRTRAPRT